MSSPTPRHVVVVTGGTRGLGRVTAEHWARAGSFVAICSRRTGEAADSAARLRDTYGVPAIGVMLDVRDEAAAAAFADAVEHDLGPADLLINNAAIIGPVGAFGRATTEAWSAALDVNVVGCANLIAAFLPHLAASARGRVVNLSGGGVGGPAPMQRTSAYVVSKIAVVGMVEVLAPELGERGVTINAIAPGALSTDFLAEVVAAGPGIAGRALFDDAAGRAGLVDDEARPFLRLLDYISSEAASWLTGRMLSARWETPEALEASRPLDDNKFRLRRIDDDLFTGAER